MEMAEWMNKMAISQMEEYEQTGEMIPLEAAIKYAQESVQLTSEEDHEHLGDRLDVLASAIAVRYLQAADIEELELAMVHSKRALALTLDGDAKLAGRLNNLANMEALRYQKTGDHADLENAINNAKRAVDITPKDDEDLSQWLYNLGYKLFYRYELTGNMALLEEACSIEQRAVKLTPDKHPSLPEKLGALSRLLSVRCKRTGKTNDLNEAVAAARRAVDITPDGHPSRIYMLHFLADILRTRHDMTGRGEDMMEAHMTIRKAVDIMPDHHTSVAAVLTSFASILQHFYKRTGNMEYIDEAIAKVRKAISTNLENHRSALGLLNNLNLYLMDRYERTKKAEDLDEAVICARKVADGTSDDDPRLATRLSHLSTRLFRQHQLTGTVEALEESIATGQKAANSLPADHPDLASILVNLSNLFLERYEQAHKTSDRDAALDCCLRAFDCDSGSPSIRIRAARRAIQLLSDQGDLPRASPLADKAVALLPLLCGRYLRRKDQLRAIQQASGLASDACSLILRTGGDPNCALEYLEHGRALIVGYLIDNRGDVSGLREVYPEKADEFDRLVHRTFMPVNMDEKQSLDSIFRQYQDREEAQKDLEQCFREIRQLQGHGQFLLPLMAADLKKHATEGPIVMVNITNIGSHALVVLPCGVQAFPLESMDAPGVELYRPWSLTRSAIREIEFAEEVDDDEAFREFLLRLWSDCVRPVLEKLGYYKASGGTQLPRIWWIGTGFASSLPFHAAGDHSAGSTENTLSWAVSSYTPTIKALAYAREKPMVTIDKNSVLVVTMPDTPGGARLPGVEVEEMAIRDAIKAPYLVKTLCQPCVDAVLEDLRQSSIAHFACHGLGHAIDPSESYLALQGSSSAVPDKLTVQAVTDAALGGAWLAYLSACSTAETKNDEFGDEALHLASGFQIAGFRHVVASMWPSNDTICVQVAGLFYRDLMERGGVQGGDRSVAAALHAAVRKISSQNSSRPSLWAQYIHSGA